MLEAAKITFLAELWFRKLYEQLYISINMKNLRLEVATYTAKTKLNDHITKMM